MSIISDLVAGGAQGILSGLGEFAIRMRAVITGDPIITPEAKGKLLEMQAELESKLATADIDLQKMQLDINKVEAADTSIFKSGWRPATGWACAFAVVIYPIIQATLPWLFQVGALLVGWNHHNIPPLPAIDPTLASNMLIALLGLGGFRTVEKIKGGK